MQAYGRELILDMHGCNPEAFTREKIQEFMDVLCEVIDMEQCDLHFWDYEGEPEEYSKAPIHLKGTSAIQFITTSNITIHTLDEMRRVYLNIFTCKYLDGGAAEKVALEFFGGNVINRKEFDRI
jgi:S-adenosylmethionine/arginine decarboxylase-like enzyme